ncbi:MAG TPA: XrtA/PEP-CTERM system-associated ATPase [Saprospiraceae bacterium]|nr:XrtA/PEP-CTERM system-associated ATPase [Saprospiraceae bacterium]
MYTSYYGFSIKPFQLNPDPRFFFGSSGHSRAMAYLRYGLSQSEGFIVITGDIGTGKTMLVKSLFQELDTSNVIAAQLVTTQLEADDLLRLVVAAFNLPYEDSNKASLLRRFEEFLRDAARQGKRILLVVDEAQNLPARSLEELRMLSNFQVADTPLLQSFLLGQESFRATLQGPGMEQLRQRVIASCHLNPLSVQETRDYIEHRLQVAGWQGNPHFDDEAYAAIYQHTQGVPRRINVFCDRLLLYGYLEELTVITEATVNAVGNELSQEKAVSGPLRAATPDFREAKAMFALPGVEQRVANLEQTVDALLDYPQWQDVQVERMGKRLVELESLVKNLQQTLTELHQLVTEPLSTDVNMSS